jgi:hypothetical protein
MLVIRATSGGRHLPRRVHADLQPLLLRYLVQKLQGAGDLGRRMTPDDGWVDRYFGKTTPATASDCCSGDRRRGRWARARGGRNLREDTEMSIDRGLLATLRPSGQGRTARVPRSGAPRRRRGDGHLVRVPPRPDDLRDLRHIHADEDGRQATSTARSRPPRPGRPDHWPTPTSGQSTSSQSRAQTNRAQPRPRGEGRDPGEAALRRSRVRIGRVSVQSTRGFAFAVPVVFCLTLVEWRTEATISVRRRRPDGHGWAMV